MTSPNWEVRRRYWSLVISFSCQSLPVRNNNFFGISLSFSFEEGSRFGVLFRRIFELKNEWIVSSNYFSLCFPLSILIPTISFDLTSRLSCHDQWTGTLTVIAQLSKDVRSSRGDWCEVVRQRQGAGIRKASPGASSLNSQIALPNNNESSLLFDRALRATSCQINVDRGEQQTWNKLISSYPMHAVNSLFPSRYAVP